MNHSETISALTEALAKAQGTFPAVQKSGKNPHLGNQYSTLDDIIAAVRKPLAINGLSFVQPLTTNEEGTFVLETLLMHQTGEWISSSAIVPAATATRGINELQAFGGALTYMRRYMLTAMLGVTTEEDADGNGASGNGQKGRPQRRPAEPSPEPTDDGNGDKPTRHWIEDPKVRARFWKWTRDQLGLSDVEVHEALNVEHIKDFDASMQAAKSCILAWVDARAESDEAQASAEELFDG